MSDKLSQTQVATKVKASNNFELSYYFRKNYKSNYVLIYFSHMDVIFNKVRHYKSRGFS